MGMATPARRKQMVKKYVSFPIGPNTLSIVFQCLRITEHLSLAVACRFTWRKSGVMTATKVATEINRVAWNKVCPIPSSMFPYDIQERMKIATFMRNQKCCLSIDHKTGDSVTGYVPDECISVASGNFGCLVQSRWVNLCFWQGKLPCNAVRFGVDVGIGMDRILQCLDEGANMLYFESRHISSGVLTILATDRRVRDVGFKNCYFDVWTEKRKHTNKLRSITLDGGRELADIHLRNFVTWCAADFLIIGADVELRMRHSAYSGVYTESAAWEGAFSRIELLSSQSAIAEFRLCSPFVCHCSFAHPTSVRCVDAPWTECSASATLLHVTDLKKHAVDIKCILAGIVGDDDSSGSDSDEWSVDSDSCSDY